MKRTTVRPIISSAQNAAHSSENGRKQNSKRNGRPANNDELAPKPGQFVVLIKKCTYAGCETWFVGSPSARFCQLHKSARLHDLQREWRKARDNGTIKMKGSRSRFSREEILEMRDMFHKMPVKEIAAHFDCCVSLIYRYQNKDPENYRVTQ